MSVFILFENVKVVSQDDIHFMSSEILNMQFQIWRWKSSTSVHHYKSDFGAWYEEPIFDGRQKNVRQKHEDNGTCFSLMDASKWNLCWLNFLIERRSISHIHPHFADGRESAHSISRQVLERGKKKVARGAISSCAQAGLARTHWHFQLITGYSHNPFSVFSVQGF